MALQDHWGYVITNMFSVIILLKCYQGSITSLNNYTYSFSTQYILASANGHIDPRNL